MTNLLDLPLDQFRGYLAEGNYPQARQDELMRAYRAKNSLSGLLDRYGEEGLEGKNVSTFFPVAGPGGMSIFDALKSGQLQTRFKDYASDALGGVLGALENPKASYDGTLPQADYDGAAMGTGGLAMGGGGVVAGRLPDGAVAANRLIGGGMSDPTQTGWTFKDVNRPQFSGAENREIQKRFDKLNIREAELPIRSMYATQPNVNSDFSTTTSSQDYLPTVVKRGGEYFVRDGHHRLTKAAEAGNQNAKVQIIDLDNTDTSTPLLDYKPPRQMTEAELAEIDRFLAIPDDGTVNANASKSAGLLAAALKEDLDPLGYQKPKMRGYLSDTDVQLSDAGENLPRQPMSWEDVEGKVVLPFYGDRTSRGLLVEGVNDLKFEQPVYTEGGVDFMVGPAAQKDRAIWASNQNIIKRIETEAEKAAKQFGERDILGLYGSMSPDANDFATFTGASMAELVKGAKITKKSAKEFDKVMRAIDPDFVGVLSPKLREWATTTSSPKRKSFIRLMESSPMQQAGFPSPAEARYSVTDPTQRDLPAGMFGLGTAKIDGSAPLMFNEPKGNLPSANVPHSTYNTQIAGDYLGSLPPVPQGLLFKDVYDAMEGKTTKSGQALNEAHKTHAIKTKMPAQVVTPQVLDGILQYLSRLEK